MTTRADPPGIIIGIEGGATRTTAVAVDGAGNELGRYEGTGANSNLLTGPELAEVFRQVCESLPWPDGLGIGLAGGWNEADWEPIRAAAVEVWPGVPCAIGNDLEAALRATDIGQAQPEPKVLVLSGTGSCCYTRLPRGEVFKVGGWGHVLGDQGSGYDIGLRGLQAALSEYDRSGRWTLLGANLLARAQLNSPAEFIGWTGGASKQAIAGLAPAVFAAWRGEDPLAQTVVEAAAAHLAGDAAACARKAFGNRRGIRFVLAGGVLLREQRFAALATRKILKLVPGAKADLLKTEAVWGAVRMAREAASLEGETRNRPQQKPPPVVSTKQLSPTERRNPRSMNLDRLPLSEAIELMLSEENRVFAPLRRESRKIERIIRAISQTLAGGGRLFYVGCGTSGRLGVLDASECPPTFQTEPERIQGIIAGGHRALWDSVEGEEDKTEAGAEAVRFRAATARDMVVGIAASGTTPFVWGALREAKERGARTVLVCFNPHLSIPGELRPWLVLAVDLGPEILTGSTRLKAGTATKLLLNMFTTLAMVRLGKVRSNLMVDVNPSNAKLRQRAARIFRELTGADEPQSWEALQRNGWRVKQAIDRWPKR